MHAKIASHRDQTTQLKRRMSRSGNAVPLAAERDPMLAISLLLIVTGAVLRFAVERSVPGVSLQRVGLILMLVGALALALALVLHYSDDANGAVTAATVHISG